MDRIGPESQNGPNRTNVDRIGPNRKTKINRMDRIEAMWIEQGRSGQNRTNVDRMDQIGPKWTK